MNLDKTRVAAIRTATAVVLLIACPMGAAVRTRGGVPQASQLDEKRLKSLLDTASTRAPSLQVPLEIEQSKDAKVREEYFAARKRQFEEHEAKVNAAADELAAMGDSIVDWLGRQYRAPIGTHKHRVIVILAKIGTPKARESLLNIAIAKYDPNQTSYSAWAARNFVKIAPDKEAILPLLKSEDPDVISVALQHLPGVSVDGRLLGSLRSLLQSTEYHPIVNFAMRMKAVSVIAKDGGTSLIAEKVAAIVDSIRTVDDMPTANEKLQPDMPGTLADNLYPYLIRALTQIEGADPYLRARREGLSNKAQSAVVIALALRRDSSVRQELRDVLLDPTMLSRTSLRCEAARALGVIGTRDDIPFLEELIRDDPLEIVDFHGPIFEMVNGQYVNTGSRSAPIRPESDPSWKTARRWYPVREAATQAIQAIEKGSAN